MTDLVLNRTSSKPLTFGGFSLKYEIMLSSGKHSSSTMTWKSYLREGIELLIKFLTASLIVKIPLLIMHIEIPLLASVYLIPFLNPVFWIIHFASSIKSPLRGIHGAEHMTIRALESGKPFTKNLLRKQNYISEKCGTNSYLPIFITSCVFTIVCLSYSKLGLGSCALLFLIGFSVAGLSRMYFKNWVQKTFFTSYPKDYQLDIAYQAGLELIRQFNQQPHPPVKIPVSGYSKAGMTHALVIITYALMLLPITIR